MSSAQPPSPHADEHQVFFGLGANLGDPIAQLRDAIMRLGTHVRDLRVSSVYDTAPLHLTDQPRFHNVAAAGATRLPPEVLLHFTQEIEAALGRERTMRYGPRRIDIDILLYDGLVLETPTLVIPHPRLVERAFVLAPLAEIAPNLIHPRLGESMAELLAHLPDADVHRLGPLFSPEG